MKKYIFILIMIPSFLYSQEDSLKDLLNFYPLQTGNYWEYKIINQQAPYPPDSTAYSIEVKGDTTLDNNLTYKILTYKDFYPNHYIYNQYERIDSLTGCVFKYYKDTSLVNNEYKIDSLFAQPGDTINSSGNFQPSGNYKTICRSIEIDTVFGVVTTVKTFFDYSIFPGGEYRLAKGFGNYLGSYCEVNCSFGKVVYAKINGIEYGNKITNIEDKNNLLPISLKLYQNYPNPFNPSTRIKYYVPNAGNVKINIYDSIGKRISKLYEGYQSSGEHEILFKANNLSSGIYYYRIEYKGQKIIRKMLLLK